MRNVKILFVAVFSSLVLAGCGDVTVNNPPRKTIVVEDKPAPIVIEKTVVEKPVIVEKTTVEKPVIIIKK